MHRQSQPHVLENVLVVVVQSWLEHSLVKIHDSAVQRFAAYELGFCSFIHFTRPLIHAALNHYHGHNLKQLLADRQGRAQFELQTTMIQQESLDEMKNVTQFDEMVLCILSNDRKMLLRFLLF